MKRIFGIIAGILIALTLSAAWIAKPGSFEPLADAKQ